MRLIRLLAVVLLAGVSACGTMQDSAATGSGSLLIDEPVSPFPYNSRFW